MTDLSKIAAPPVVAATLPAVGSERRAAAVVVPSPSAPAAAPGALPCTCGRRGVCTACVLADLEADPFVASTGRMLDTLAAPARNVIPLRKDTA